jgi:hypothetical protein
MESVTEKKFASYLTDLGFPQASVVYQPMLWSNGQGRRFRPDVALVNPKTNEPLAIIEIKSNSDKTTLIRAFEQLEPYLATLKNKALPAYVVTPSVNDDSFSFYTLGIDGLPKQLPSVAWLNFESLVSGKFTATKELLVEEKDATLDFFHLICFLLAGFVVLLTVADYFHDGALLTTERITLLGAAIALVVIPYVEKIKILGIEIERTNANKDK